MWRTLAGEFNPASIALVDAIPLTVLDLGPAREGGSSRSPLAPREKAGSIERARKLVKSELAAGVMPCERLGVNAARLRLGVLTHNVRSPLKPSCCRGDVGSLIFNMAEGILLHARALVCRLWHQSELRAIPTDGVSG